ncbi:MAG TPA: acyl carrier protein [Burkholderiaceae bacterium]
MNQAEIKDVIGTLFKENDSFENIGFDEDYFDKGISSLTIIGFQVKVEEKLGFTVETRDLMSFATVNQWIDAYTKKSEEIGGKTRVDGVALQA